MTAPDRYSIRVHTEHSSVWKKCFQFFFRFLRSSADMLHLPSALRTECLGTLRKTTVMAHQPSVGAVIGHRHAAAGTLRHAAALAAKQHPAVAAAIQKQNTLLAAVKVFFEFCAQRCADNPAVATAQLFLHVGKHHFRQGFSIITLPQFDTAIQALLGGIGSFYGRRSRTQHQGCLILCAQILRHLSRMIARRIFRLIRAFLLLVQNNQSQMRQRGKNSATGSKYQRDLPTPDPLPLIVALCHTKGAVEHHGTRAEICAELVHHLWRQGNLRYQNNDAFSE